MKTGIKLKKNEKEKKKEREKRGGCIVNWVCLERNLYIVSFVEMKWGLKKTLCTRE